ncbi:hypothetical protein FKO01_10595 [Mesorhizobium sp. B2-3-3]|uniref:hypothetical protein n=1 Tax=Mesorhizobium sp. B2-4-15 TaxID=2589934 RepID=UPI001151FC96|nr:hypothetical protein [Mesorhizobium sp. B2-4-15]TPK75330.1 hypothetical protein FJ930_04315 [Mesorhizobium sp. B2-4-15]TPN35549.1 hypothetical protein FKO01_10595 [Mesorhizobium sp. B2-3-3]
MAKVSPHALKGAGYVISTISVILLAVVSWKGASQDPMLAACLFCGAATSIAGMCCRWTSYAIEKRRKRMQRDALGSG